MPPLTVYKEYRKDLQEIIQTLCKNKGIEMMPDHVHLLLSTPPKERVKLHGVPERKKCTNDV